jgi:ATP-dependent exoDNAse (exonuclease V) beta subunit
MENLIICKASAGSGKTYKLTGEYLKLVFDPHISFKSILAVTFTNKATSEMKQRILSAIHKISKGEETGYEEELCKEHNYTASQLKEKAKNLLNLMLNQYSYFKISTIDSFFQQVIKSIAYELQLDSNFTLELDTKSVLELAVSRLIDNFDAQSEESKWIMQLVDEKFSKGNRWKFSDDIVGFADKAFEHINMTDNQNEDSKKISDCGKMLAKIKKDFISELNALGAKGVDMISRAGLNPTDFSGGNRSFALRFGLYAQASTNDIKEPTKTMIEACSDVDKWYTKTSPLKNSIIACADGDLMQILNDICTMLTGSRYRQFCSAEVVLKHIDKYALAYKIDELQKEICEEQNLFLLQSSMPLLKGMIDESDTPFIYEKFGYTLQHFMIDEFQDTSTLNWNNFLPLIKNSTDANHKSLIVGDVKQAIYRWRGGDWNLLDNTIEQQFNGSTKMETLGCNWRSCENIVKFNNWCFNSIYDMLSHEIEELTAAGEYDKSFGEIFERTYGEVAQNVPEKNIGTGGYVSVESIEGKAEEYTELACQWVIAQLDELAELGYEPGNIAILVRSNKLGSQVASYLAEAQNAMPEKAERYRFVSNESVKLGNNQAVRLLVAAVQFLVAPDDTFAQGQLIWLYFAISQSLEAASEAIQKLPREGGAEVVWNMLPEEFKKLRTSYMQLDIVQLCSRLNRILLGQNNPADVPFLNEFEDRVQTFNERNGSNLQLFIEWWNEMGCTQAISMNEDQNAIQILSIHKSKGLEFKAVIIPFYSWSNSNSDIIWCKTDEEPFSDYSSLSFPIPYTQSAAGTCFSKEYYNEHFMRHIDNLNILYVALTRASRDMRICTMTPPKNSSTLKDDLILPTMIAAYAGKPEAAEAGIVCSDDGTRITMGQPEPYVPEKRKETVCKLSQPAKAPTESKISIVCHSDDYFSSVDFDREKKINLGSLYHHIFEYIITPDDVEDAVSTVVNEGFIAAEEAPEYISKVRKFIARQPDWFSPKWQTLTEQSILVNGDIKRPDRILESDSEVIVIDYKFTRNHNPEYNQQVSVYADALRQLTNKKVRGYLWYVWPNEKVEVVAE